MFQMLILNFFCLRLPLCSPQLQGCSHQGFLRAKLDRQRWSLIGKEFLKWINQLWFRKEFLFKAPYFPPYWRKIIFLSAKSFLKPSTQERILRYLPIIKERFESVFILQWYQIAHSGLRISLMQIDTLQKTWFGSICVSVCVCLFTSGYAHHCRPAQFL